MSVWSLFNRYSEPTGDFTLDENGRIARDATVATAITMALGNHFGQWWADPGHGSRFAELMSGTPSPDLARDLETAAREALGPLEREGRIRDVKVRVDMDRTRARVSIAVFDVAAGKPITVEVKP